MKHLGLQSNAFDIATQNQISSSSSITYPKGIVAFTPGVATPTYFAFRTLNIWTPVARTTTNTSPASNIARSGTVTAATAGSVATIGTNAGTMGIRLSGGAGFGGFKLISHFAPSCAAVVAGHRYFYGLSSVQLIAGNVDYGTLTNCIGLIKTASSSNLFLEYGGSASQTPIDLGVNFPADGLSTDLYRLTITSLPNSTGVDWMVERIGTAFVASGTLSGALGTVLPAAGTNLNFSAAINNNTTALAAAIDMAYTEITYYV